MVYAFFMKKVVGFSLFCIAAGMLIMLLIQNDFWGFVIAVGLIAVGFQLFCCDDKK